MSAGSPRGSEADLATMLAEMDDRLRRLQRELEEVAVPITRRGVTQHGAGRPVLEPTSSPAPQLDRELDAPHGSPTAAHAEPAPPPRQPYTRPVVRPQQRPAEAAPPHAAEAHPGDPPPPAPRPRSRITAVQGNRPGTATTTRPAVSAQPRTPPARPARPALPEPVVEPVVADALVRETILEAEEEARRIVEEARDRIAAVGLRTRSLLEQSLTAPGQPTGAEPAPAPAPPPVRQRGATRPDDERAYQGAVTVEAGPFADVAQLKEFEDALASIPTVDDVYIRTFERYYAHFELRIAEPTLLIAELRTRSPDPLRVIDATGHDPRLEIVRDSAGRAG